MIKIPQVIQNKGLRLNDPFELNIFQKGKHRLKMTRTRYLIVSAESYHFDFKENVFYLPTLQNDHFKVEIRLLNFESDESEGRYFVQSLEGNLFKLNGITCSGAFVERNDILEIGFNKFIFRQIIESEKNLNIPVVVMESDLPILIEGETGTGKTRLAKIIHEESNVIGHFVHLNLSSFSSSLIESELFGHIKGAFTGASQDRKGAILEASKGTLYLDEIDSLSIELQTKLLLFLESKEFRPVGLDRTIKAQVRIIFSSGQDLKTLVAKGKMRSDFYFRINNGYKINLPSLRNNQKLIEDFCLEFASTKGIVIEKELLSFYQNCSWPGNIRELKAHLQKKAVMSAGKKFILNEVDLELVELNKILITENKILTLEQVKIRHVLDVYYHCNQNLIETSKLLDICPNTVRSLINKKVA